MNDPAGRAESARRVEFGISVPSGGDVRALAIVAEESGFDLVGCGEHVA